MFFCWTCCIHYVVVCLAAALSLSLSLSLSPSLLPGNERKAPFYSMNGGGEAREEEEKVEAPLASFPILFFFLLLPPPPRQFVPMRESRAAGKGRSRGPPQKKKQKKTRRGERGRRSGCDKRQIYSPLSMVVLTTRVLPAK